MLPHIINNKNNKLILFVGIGNVLKRDDGAGVYITRKINPSKHIKAITVEVSIENYIGKINSLNPDILILVDSMDFNQMAGYWDLLPIEEVRGYTTNTHNITLKKVSELFYCKAIYILGIQPKDINFGETLSEEVIKSAESIISKIHSFYEVKI